MMQTAAVARAFPADRTVPEDVGRDFGAVGVGSILAGFFGSFAVDASPPRTAIVHVSGGKSQLSSLLALAAMVVLVAFLGGLAAYVTLPALGGVLVFIALRIFRFHTILKIWRRGGYEVLLTISAMLAVVLFPVERGMLAAIVLSLVHGIYVVARPPSAELLRVQGTTIWWPPNDEERTERVPGVLVFDPAAPITFTNAQYVTETLRNLVSSATPPVRLVVIDASKVIYLDYTGTRAVRRLFRDFTERGIMVAIARLSEARSQAAVRRSGIIRAIGENHVFRSVQDAVVALGPRASASTNS
jgi:MFS superfamily sulfate permease-like transporter